MGVHPKVVAASGGAISGVPVMVISCWILGHWNIVMPDDVVAAFASILSTVFALLGGYITADTPGNVEPKA